MIACFCFAGRRTVYCDLSFSHRPSRIFNIDYILSIDRGGNCIGYFCRCGSQGHSVCRTVSLTVVGSEHQCGRSGNGRLVAVIDIRINRIGAVHTHLVGQGVVVRVLKDGGQIQRPRRTHCGVSSRGVHHILLDCGSGVGLAALRVDRYNQIIVIKLIVLTGILDCYTYTIVIRAPVYVRICSAICCGQVPVCNDGRFLTRGHGVAVLCYTQIERSRCQCRCRDAIHDGNRLFHLDADLAYQTHVACTGTFLSLRVVYDFYGLYFAGDLSIGNLAAIIQVAICHCETRNLRPSYFSCCCRNIQRHRILRTVGLTVVGGKHQLGRAGCGGCIAVIGIRGNSLGIAHLHLVGQRIIVRILKDGGQIQRPCRTDGGVGSRGVHHTLLDRGGGVGLAALCVDRYNQIIVIPLLAGILNRYTHSIVIRAPVCIRVCGARRSGQVPVCNDGRILARSHGVAVLCYTQIERSRCQCRCRDAIHDGNRLFHLNADLAYQTHVACTGTFLGLRVVYDFYGLYFAGDLSIGNLAAIIQVAICHCETRNLRPRRFRCIRIRCGDRKEAHGHEQTKEQGYCSLPSRYFHGFSPFCFN